MWCCWHPPFRAERERTGHPKPVLLGHQMDVVLLAPALSRRTRKGRGTPNLFYWDIRRMSCCWHPPFRTERERDGAPQTYFIGTSEGCGAAGTRPFAQNAKRTGHPKSILLGHQKDVVLLAPALSHRTRKERGTPNLFYWDIRRMSCCWHPPFRTERERTGHPKPILLGHRKDVVLLAPALSHRMRRERGTPSATQNLVLAAWSGSFYGSNAGIGTRTGVSAPHGRGSFWTVKAEQGACPGSQMLVWFRGSLFVLSAFAMSQGGKRIRADGVGLQSTLDFQFVLQVERD